MAKKNGVVERIWFSELMDKQLNEIAEEQGLPKTKIIENAFSLYYKQDVMPEHIVLGRMTQMQQQLELMDRKLETLAGIFYTTMPYIIGVLPNAETKTDEKGKKYNPALEKGADVFGKLIINYRKQMQANKIGFMQKVWADMQEEIFYTHYGVNDETVKADSGERTAGH